ncbi:hypothetical protein LBMAG52_42580 [Planctomycetia bacterium]|nr:hypothetical protein LBMAG52_42580 [Planctomycetia bacterium]
MIEWFGNAASERGKQSALTGQVGAALPEALTGTVDWEYCARNVRAFHGMGGVCGEIGVIRFAEISCALGCSSLLKKPSLG